MGHHCTRDPKRQEEAVHQRVHEEAQGPEWETRPIQHEVHPPGGGLQGPMVQEEHNPQEEVIQAVVQAEAVHLQAGGSPPTTPPRHPPELIIVFFFAHCRLMGRFSPDFSCSCGCLFFSFLALRLRLCHILGIFLETVANSWR